MKEKENLTDHNYDGIQEYDFQLPRWWLAILYLTILFGAIYYFHYEIGDGPTLVQEYQKEKSDYDAKMLVKNLSVKTSSDEELLAMSKKPEQVAAGLAVYKTRCLACHGDKGQGGIGPNLTDDYWLHGGKLTQIFHTITKGVPEKGMPPWESMLKSEEISQLVALIRTLRGTKPAGAKAPQGELFKE